MKIKFNQPCELEVVNSFDETTEVANTENEVFKKGEIVEADIIDENEAFQTVTLEYGDGTVSFGVPKAIFEVIEFD